MQYSVVVPLYNESENLAELFRRLDATMRGLDGSYEIVFVNDGSRDETSPMLDALAAEHPQVTVVHLSRNFGQENAVCAGLETALGEQIVLIDGDLQDPPELIADLVAKKAEGYEIVYGVKHHRKENFLRRALTRSFYHLMFFLSQIRMPIDAGLFSVFDAEVGERILRFHESNKYISGLRSYLGFSQSPFYYQRQARARGKAKSLFQLIRMGLNAFFSFTIAPLRISSILCMLVLAVSIAFLLFGLWKTPMDLFLLATAAIICISMASLCEYIGRIHIQVKERPDYIIRSVTRGAVRQDRPSARNRSDGGAQG